MTFGQGWIRAALVAAAMAIPVLTLDAQVGKSQGVVDANTAAEKDLAGMPHMSPAIAKASSACGRSRASPSSTRSSSARV